MRIGRSGSILVSAAYLQRFTTWTPVSFWVAPSPPFLFKREYKSWGDEGYTREELVAELGSAFLCADLELHQEPQEENASYIATWLEVLKNDNRAIFTAAAHAQRAADYPDPP